MSNPPGTPDAESVQAKRDMFIQVYRQHRASIFNYIYYRVGDADLADDLTSDVFERFVEKYDQSARNGRPVASWLYAVARNRVIDHQRRAGLVQWQPLPEQTEAREPSNPANQAENRLTQECLMTAMTQLTEDQRRVILLKFIEKRTNREIGELLGKAEGAIKSLQHRALAALRRILDKDPCYEG
jgi:RNA polymerase sigma-70 factor (ECF subfamily)